jgi:glycosyltransferase 2 family protein
MLAEGGAGQIDRVIDRDGDPGLDQAVEIDLARRTGLRSRRGRLLLNAATVVVTVVFSYIAIRGINVTKAWHALASSDLLWLLPALGAFGLATVARAYRWRSLFAPERRPPVGAVANAMMIGYLYNNILPARAGEVARVVSLRNRQGISTVEIAGTVVLERLFDVLAILVVFFATEPWLPHLSWTGTAAIAAIVLACAVAVVAFALVVFEDRGLRLVLGPLQRLPFVSRRRLEWTVTQLTYGLSALRRRNVALAAFLWTLAAWMLSSLCAYLVTLAFHLHVPFACGVLVMVAVGLAMILPSPPAAVGVFEGAALIGLKAYGISSSAALPYALVLHLVNFVPYIVVGFVLLHYNARHRATRTRSIALGSSGRARTQSAEQPLIGDGV